MRNIKEGDTVAVMADEESTLWDRVHHNLQEHYARKLYRVMHSPSDVGDLWYLEGYAGDVLSINPCSASFEGFEKIDQGEKGAYASIHSTSSREIRG